MTRRLFLVVENEPPEDRAVEVRCEWCRWWAVDDTYDRECEHIPDERREGHWMPYILAGSGTLARFITPPRFGCPLFEPKATP
jgi:hypothetical protein